jgi:long-subunit acyl-CoA synthetase (AMP-forming)
METEGPVMFNGYYKNKGATEKKIIVDVFEKGDA